MTDHLIQTQAAGAPAQRFLEYLDRLNEAHLRSGLGLREVATASDLDPTYVHYILKGDRRPQRDVIIALGIAYRLERIEIDELLLLANFPPLGRSALRDYREQQRGEYRPGR